MHEAWRVIIGRPLSAWIFSCVVSGTICIHEKNFAPSNWPEGAAIHSFQWNYYRDTVFSFGRIGKRHFGILLNFINSVFKLSAVPFTVYIVHVDFAQRQASAIFCKFSTQVTTLQRFDLSHILMNGSECRSKVMSFLSFSFQLGQFRPKFSFSIWRCRPNCI